MTSMQLSSPSGVVCFSHTRRNKAQQLHWQQQQQRRGVGFEAAAGGGGGGGGGGGALTTAKVSNPATIEEVALQAQSAVGRALKEGKSRQLLQLLLPVDQRQFNYLDTEPRDYPCSIKDEFMACCKVTTSILKRLSSGIGNDEVVVKRIGELENEMDPVAVLYPSDKSVAAIVFPISETLKQFMPYLLLGFGAFLAFDLPALAELGRHGGATAVLRGATVPEIINSGWAGLMAGCLHTLAGPDHLAALAPLCIGRAKVESAIVGALWGCGHDAGQIIFGLLFLLLKGKLKIDVLQVWASRVVGITLLAIGAVGLKEAQEVPVSVLAAESTGAAPPIVESRKATHRFRTFATGIVYGLQPDALIMILPALALPSRLAGAAYLGMFLLGTIIAMGSYTAFIGSCGEALQNRVPWITRRLTIISSVVAIMFGVGVLLGELFGINFFH